MRRRTLLLSATLVALPLLSAHSQTADNGRRGAVPSAVSDFPLLHRLVRFDSATSLRVVPNNWRGEQLRVTFLTPRSLAASRWRTSIATSVWRCSGGVNASLRKGSLPPGAEVLVTPDAIARPWAALDSATRDRAFIGLQVDSPVRPVSRCSAGFEPAIVRAGVQLVAGGESRVKFQYVHEAQLQFQDHLVVPVISELVPATVVVPNGSLLRTPPTSLRSYFSVDQIGPDRHGRFGDARLTVTTLDPSPAGALSVALPDSVLTSVWRDFLPWRLNALDSRQRVGTLPALVPPERSGYQSAFRRYEAGDALGAAATALAEREQLAGEIASPSDSRFADLLLGSVFLAYGDSVAAREEYADALRTEPCLQLAQHPDFNRVLEEARSESARCTTVPLGKQLGYGLLFPGGGQWEHGNASGGKVATAMTVGLFVAALGVEVTALQKDNQYRNSTATNPAPLLDEANSWERAARGIMISAGAVWLASAVVGVVTEASHARQVANEQRYESRAMAQAAER
ncbi:MAG TPA: hypothetical protein VIJ16_10560 [Gemmatimonadaceae bacterium]